MLCLVWCSFCGRIRKGCCSVCAVIALLIEINLKLKQCLWLSQIGPVSRHAAVYLRLLWQCIWDMTRGQPVSHHAAVFPCLHWPSTWEMTRGLTFQKMKTSFITQDHPTFPKRIRHLPHELELHSLLMWCPLC